MSQLLNVIFFDVLGLPEGLNLATLKWVLTGYVLALCLVLYGVALLARLHPAPQWVMLGITLFLTIQLAAAPAGGSPLLLDSTDLPQPLSAGASHDRELCVSATAALSRSLPGVQRWLTWILFRP